MTFPDPLSSPEIDTSKGSAFTPPRRLYLLVADRGHLVVRAATLLRNPDCGPNPGGRNQLGNETARQLWDALDAGGTEDPNLVSAHRRILQEAERYNEHVSQRN